MQYKFVLLKTSWGIVILLDMEEIINPVINKSDIEIAEKIFLRISDSINLNRIVIETWIGAGIKDVAGEIQLKVRNATVCFELNQLDYSNVDFQEEGLYCAVQCWIEKYYGIPKRSVNIDYDERNNRYVFYFSD